MEGVETADDAHVVRVVARGAEPGAVAGHGRAARGGAIVLTAVLLLGSATPVWSSPGDDDAGAVAQVFSGGEHDGGPGDPASGAEPSLEVPVDQDGTDGQPGAAKDDPTQDVPQEAGDATSFDGSHDDTVVIPDVDQHTEQPQDPAEEDTSSEHGRSGGQGEESTVDPDPEPDNVDGVDATSGEESPPVGEEQEAPEPGSTGTATFLRTGNALAVGNLGEHEVLQVIEVLVVDGGTVRIEQIAILVSVGSARAHTGGNVVVAGAGDSQVSASAVTGNTVAIGNASFTDIDQRLALEGGSGQRVTAEQFALIEHTGVAYAASGGNQAIAGSAGTSVTGSSVTSTGHAYAIGNLSEVFIHQGGAVAASGDAWVISEQHATVVNRGVAVADSGGNLVGTPSGSGSLETGVAIAEGSVSANDVEQRATALAVGGATVEMRQGALILNLGVAMARTGGNHLGAGSATEGAGVDLGQEAIAFAGFEEALLSIVLADSTDLAGLGALLQRLLSAALEEPIELWSHWSDETTTSWEDEEHATFVELVQRALIFDLGRAWVESGANLTSEPAHDVAGSDALRDHALAEVRTGDALAIGNLSIVEVCQRMGMNADPPLPSCHPEPPLPAPDPTPEVAPVPEQEPTGEGAGPRPGPSVLASAVTRLTPAAHGPDVGVRREETPQGAVLRVRVDGSAGASALPRTGTGSTTLVVLGLFLGVVGAAVLSRSSRRYPR